MPQHHLAVLLEMLAEAQRPVPAIQQGRQPVLARDERHRAEILAVEVEEVEQVVTEAVAAAGREVGLQRRKVRGAAGALDDQFAVEDRDLRRERGKRLGDRRAEAIGPVLAAAGQQLHVAAVDVRLQPVAVELDLVHPGVALRRLRFEGRERRRDEAGEGIARLAGPRLRSCVWRFGARGLSRGDVLDRATRDHRGGLFLEDVGIGRARARPRRSLDQQPVLALLAAPGGHADEMPAARELCALEPEIETALLQSAHRVAVGFPAAAVPDDDLAAAVLALRDPSLEVGVVERMVLDMHREPLVARHEARTPGDRPTRERVADLQAEVVMQPTRRMLLDDERVARAAAVGPGGLVGRGEVSLVAVGS